MRHMLLIGILLTALSTNPPAAIADEIEVDAQLFLAVDVSRSMTPRELEIQRRGYAEALVSDPVVKAIGNGLLGQIALTYVEWAGSSSQRVVVDWTLVRDRDDVEAFASQLTAEFDSALRRTSISGALNYATRSIAENGFTSYRKIIDVSGDGPNNHGSPVVPARDNALAQGITINGLPLMTREGMGSQFYLDDLDEYYRNCVIGGPRAFVIPVTEWETFPEAVRRKLVLELAGGQPAIHRVAAPAPVSVEYDCLIGEKIWRRFQGDFLSP